MLCHQLEGLVELEDVPLNHVDKNMNGHAAKATRISDI